MAEIGAGIVVTVWIIFSIVWFYMLSKSGGMQGGILLYLAISVGIFVGGTILAVVVLSDPLLTGGAVALIVGIVWVVIKDTDMYKNRQTMKGVTKHDGVSLDSSEELLKKLSTVKQGDVIPFGRYDWRVLAVMNGKALLIANQIVAKRCFHKDSQAEGAIWEKCTLRAYLNGAFYNKNFGPWEKTLILESTLKNMEGGKTIGYAPKPTPLPDTQDKIFVLSEEELGQYMSNTVRRVLKIGDETVYWWIRNTKGKGYEAACVRDNGKLEFSFSGMDYGVRPAMWVKIK